MTLKNPSLVLVVEDDDKLRATEAAMLVDAGYQVIEAGDGVEAMELLKRHGADLILCDVRMPRSDGLELLQWVRCHPTMAVTPFLLVSAKSDKSDVRAGMLLGADDYITKPFHPEDLLSAIALRLKRTAKLAEIETSHRRFLSKVLPHELRAPLNAMLDCGYLLDEAARAKQGVSPAEAADFGRIIHRSGHHLLRFAEDLSLWARLQGQLDATNQGAVRPQRFESLIDPPTVSRTLQHCAEDIGRGEDLRVSLEAAKVYVPADAVALLTAFRHLVTNALKFSQAGELVEVAGYSLGKNYVFEVRDRGRGLVAEITEAGAPAESPGLGVGLSIVRALARLSGGSFDLSPATHAPTGATACLELPLAGGAVSATPWPSREVAVGEFAPANAR